MGGGHVGPHAIAIDEAERILVNEKNEAIVAMRDNPEARRYEADLDDGSLAVKDYRLGRDRIAFTHTEVPTEHRHRGIAGQLTKFALDDAVARGLKLMPYCPYTAWFIERNPEYQGHILESFGNE